MFFQLLFIKTGVDRVEILGIHAVLRQTKGIAEALIMDELALAKELEGLADVGIVYHSQKVVIGNARLLLCYYHVFATFWGCQKTRKILIFQGLSALLKLTIFQKFQ